MEASLYGLLTELLSEIYRRLELEDLLSLRLTCRSFNDIILNFVLLLFIKNDMLITNQLAPEMLAR